MGLRSRSLSYQWIHFTFGVKLFFPRAHLTRSPAAPRLRLRAFAPRRRDCVCGRSPFLARWRSRCGGRGLRQAGGVAACPAAGYSRLSSFICCGPIIPQVWSGMSRAGSEALRAGTGGIRFMVGGGRPKADHVGFFQFNLIDRFPRANK